MISSDTAEPPTRRDTAVAAVAAMAEKIPVFGPGIRVVIEHTAARRAARGCDFVEALASGLTDDQVDDLEDLFAHDERLQDMLWEGLDAAMRSRVEAKRRALGAILADTVREPELAAREELELLHQALAELGEAHLRTLAWLDEEARAHRNTSDEGEAAGLKAEDPRVAALVRHGLAAEGATWRGLQHIVDISPFGQRMLAYLRATGLELPTSDEPP